MARLLFGELVAGALANYAAANLAAELTAIQADAGDGIKLAMPAAGNITPYERLVITGGEADAAAGYVAHLEVYEGDLLFLDPYTDQDAERAVYRAPATLRLTFFNNRGATKAVCETQRRRYSVALFNLFNKAPDLGDPTTALRRVVPTAVRYDRQEDQGGVIKARVMLEVLCGGDAGVEEVQP